MICFPNAKINIGLNILSKRSDGFHNLESVFYPIGWRDALEAVPSEIFRFDTSGLPVPGDVSRNLIVRAVEQLEIKTGRKLEASVHLHKVIPMGAGLGGGSADGAFALKLFNDLFDLGLSVPELQELAAGLGSDCPFFIENKPVLAYDRGIRFRQVDLNLQNYYVVCVNPGIHISTAEAYASVKPGEPVSRLEELVRLPVREWEGCVVNDFESPMLHRYEVLREVKENLYRLGAMYASMTGSGSTFYGIFDQEPEPGGMFKGMIVWKGKL